MHPGRDALLDETQQTSQSNAQKTQRCDGYKHRVGAIGAGVARNQITDTGYRRVEIREHHADQAAADGEPQTGHDVRHRRRQDNVNPKLSLAAAEGAADFGETVVDVFYALLGVDDDREKR